MHNLYNNKYILKIFLNYLDSSNGLGRKKIKKRQREQKKAKYSKLS
jgi:hypothetical protein